MTARANKTEAEANVFDLTTADIAGQKFAVCLAGDATHLLVPGVDQDGRLRAAFVPVDATNGLGRSSGRAPSESYGAACSFSGPTVPALTSCSRSGTGT
jgi:hypothetical protein